MEVALEELTKLFKLLSDPTRLKILMHITSLGPVPPREISRDLGKPVNSVSYYRLGFLSRTVLTNKKREGKRELYTLLNEELRKLLSLLANYFKRKTSISESAT